MGDISCIYKQVFIGNYNQACDINLLKKNNIKSVLHLGCHKKSNKILLLYKKYNIHHKFIEMRDMQNIDINPYCTSASEYINYFTRRGDNILVHCKMGISRSPTVVAHYLMTLMHDHMKKQKSVHPVLDEIIDLIRINRPCINPNSGFITQLKQFEKEELNIYNSSLSTISTTRPH